MSNLQTDYFKPDFQTNYIWIKTSWWFDVENINIETPTNLI